jgi:tRNA modification GTPase
LNALASRDVAIVTEIAGTTRDVLEVDLDIEGYSVRLYDTAGIRETADVIEAEGIRRALMTVRDADIVLSLTEIGAAATAIIDGETPQVRIGTKADLHGEVDGYDICISTLTGHGLNRLRNVLSLELERRGSGMTMAVPARRRHRLLLEESLGHITAAIDGYALGLDLRAEHLRSAGQALGRITGQVDVEDLLGVIFSEFCVGK